MVHVNYNERMGYYYAPATNGKKCKVWLCGANCLWAEINFYAKKEDGKRVQMVQFVSFIADNEHLNRCLKNGVKFGYQGLTFFADKMNADLWKAVKALTENGYKVTIK